MASKDIEDIAVSSSFDRGAATVPGPGGAAVELARAVKLYEDLPVEALVKEDLLRQGVAFSGAALRQAERAKSKSYFIFSFDRIPISEMQRDEHQRAPEEIALEGGPWQLRRTIVSVRVNPKSPYTVEMRRDGAGGGSSPDPSDDGGRGLVLRVDGSEIAKVSLPAPPPYYSRTLSSGRPLTEIAPSIEWGYLVYLTVFRLCQYVGGDEECRFCDINENFRQQRAAGRPYVTVKSVDDVVEAMAVIAEAGDVSEAYTITGGAIVGGIDGMAEGEFYARYAEAIESRFPGRWIGKVVTQALPRGDVERYKAAGIRIYHPNFEVWDREKFDLICPGKARAIGRDTWIRRIEEAAEVFGPSRVIPNFVAGVELSRPYGFATVAEALASTAEGLDYFMGQGIVPRFTTWCPEPLSELGRSQGPAPLDYHAGLLRLWRETHRRHRLPAPPGYGPPGLGRAVFSVSAFMDVIDPETPVAAT
jgi:hypothetical protein